MSFMEQQIQSGLWWIIDGNCGLKNGGKLTVGMLQRSPGAELEFHS